MPHALCVPHGVLRPCQDLGAGERRRLQLPVHPPRSPSRAQSPKTYPKPTPRASLHLSTCGSCPSQHPPAAQSPVVMEGEEQS